MIEFFVGLSVSDVCSGWPGLSRYASTQAGHFAIGTILAFVPGPLRAVVFSLWLAKEVPSDIAGCWPKDWVALDSITDLALGVLGVVVATAVRTKCRRPQVTAPHYQKQRKSNG